MKYFAILLLALSGCSHSTGHMVHICRQDCIKQGLKLSFVSLNEHGEHNCYCQK